jgi:hypothetical protein
MWKFLPFSFVIYSLYDIVVNANDGLVGLLTVSQCIDHLSHQLASRHTSGGPQSTIHYNRPIRF